MFTPAHHTDGSSAGDRRARANPFGGIDNPVAGAWADPRLLRFLRALLGMALLCGACGNVSFIDAPNAPRSIVVLYSAQEDVTVLRWRIGAPQLTSGLRFQWLDASGAWQPIDFSKSVFPGGVAACGDGAGRCAQLVLPGRYQPPPAPATPLRALDPTYGVLPGDTPTLRVYDKMLVLQSYFNRGNATLTTTFNDAIGGDPVYPFPRALERAVWERRAVCVPGFHPSDVQFAPLADPQQPWPAPAPLSTGGLYCAALRAVKTDGEPSVDEPVPVDTLPDVTAGDHLYTVPTEPTPFSYQIVLDLSIPVADLCAQAVKQIESTVASSLAAFPPLRKLPTLDLSAQPDPLTGVAGTPCHQSATRAIDAASVAQAVKIAAAGWPERHQRFFLLYFNNLRAPLPPTLTRSFDDFMFTIVSPPPPAEFAATFWAFGPPEMSGSYAGWGISTDWLSATDSTFPASVQDLGMQNLPMISEIQDPLAPVPILSAADAQKLDGGMIRLCEVSVTPVIGAGVQPVYHDASGGLVYLPPSTPQWPVLASDPPAYLLQVPAVWAVQASGFMAHQSHIRYEVCTRFCDHGFTAESGTKVPDGWLGSFLCMGPPPEAKS